MAAFAKSWRRETGGGYRGHFSLDYPDMVRWAERKMVLAPVRGVSWTSRPATKSSVSPACCAGILSKPISERAFLVHSCEKLQEISTEIHAWLQAFHASPG